MGVPSPAAFCVHPGDCGSLVCAFFVLCPGSPERGWGCCALKSCVCISLHSAATAPPTHRATRPHFWIIWGNLNSPLTLLRFLPLATTDQVNSTGWGSNSSFDCRGNEKGWPRAMLGGLLPCRVVTQHPSWDPFEGPQYFIWDVVKWCLDPGSSPISVYVILFKYHLSYWLL